MNASVLTLAGADLEAIVGHCRRELPNEACGLLGGRDGRVESLHPVKSAPPSPSRFTMDPGSQYRALEAIGRAGQELIGIYHSHPGGPASPSSVDVDEAFWPATALPNYPGVFQVIVSLRDRAAPVVKGYLPAAGAFVEARIVIDPVQGEPENMKNGPMSHVQRPAKEEPMSVTVRIPTPLQGLTGGKSEVACSATSVAGLLEALEIEHPGLAERLCEGGRVRRFVNVYVNGEDIRTLAAEATALKDGDAVAIIAAIAGGRFTFF